MVHPSIRAVRNQWEAVHGPQRVDGWRRERLRLSQACRIASHTTLEIRRALGPDSLIPADQELAAEHVFYGQSPCCTKILDFRGFDSSIIISLRGGIFMSIGSFPESLSQQTSAGILGREIGRTPKVCAHHPSKACRTLVRKWTSRPGDSYAKHGLRARS